MRPVRDGPPLAPAPLRMPVALREFLRAETAGGAVLMIAVALALVWANSPWRGAYDALWRTVLELRLGRFGLAGDLREWVNEGLMALFFLVVGLEIKRELVDGELRTWRQAALPVVAAAGGMLIPAAIYAALNARGPGAAGWGVPMATDIAFALGVLALLGPRVPAALKLFLLALAIVDDLGSILVVALFYSGELRPPALALAAVLVLAILGLRRARIYWTPLYVAAGLGPSGYPPRDAAPHQPHPGQRARAGMAAGRAARGARHGLHRRAPAARPPPDQRLPGGAGVRPGQRGRHRARRRAFRARRAAGARRGDRRPRPGQARRDPAGGLARAAPAPGRLAGRRELAAARGRRHRRRHRLHRAAVRRRPGLPRRRLRGRGQARPAARLGGRRAGRGDGPARRTARGAALLTRAPAACSFVQKTAAHQRIGKLAAARARTLESPSARPGRSPSRSGRLSIEGRPAQGRSSGRRGPSPQAPLWAAVGRAARGRPRTQRQESHDRVLPGLRHAGWPARAFRRLPRGRIRGQPRAAAEPALG